MIAFMGTENLVILLGKRKTKVKRIYLNFEVSKIGQGHKVLSLPISRSSFAGPLSGAACKFLIDHVSEPRYNVTRGRPELNLNLREVSAVETKFHLTHVNNSSAIHHHYEIESQGVVKKIIYLGNCK